MLRRIIRFALRQRVLILGATALLIIVGVRSFLVLPVEAFPDVEDVHVQVISQWAGHAAEEMEKSVTLSIERQMNGLPNLTNLRSISMFGLSVVTMTFEDGVTDYFARQQALERLQNVTVPAGVQPGLASLSNSTGDIFRYTVQSTEGTQPLTELKSLQDWVIEPAFRTVPGVTDVVSFGGQIKQYQVDVDPSKLQAYGLSLAQVEQAIASANANAGGGYIAHGYEKQVVRGVGLFQSANDIARVAVASRSGVPVRVGDVGVVHLGGAPREGIVAKDSLDDIVEGIVLMRKGENALDVLKPVREKAMELNRVVLPKGVRLVPFYDRANLVRHTVRTVEENLAIGAGLVLLILIVFLGDWRAATIVGLVIPLSLLVAFVLMQLEHVSANLISLGAVDFGIIVDAAVVMVEAFMVRLALSPPPTADDLRRTDEHAVPPAVVDHASAVANRRHDYAIRASVEKRHLLAGVAESMGRPILFAKAIVITAFLPIFTFQRVEKRIFSPMAFTLTFALLGSLLLSLTLVPVLASFAMRATPHARETLATRWLQRLFRPALDWVIARPRLTIGVAVALLVIALGVGTRLGTEFLPELDEGNIWLTVTMPVGMSLEQGKRIEVQIRHIVRSYPQVAQVVTQLGRPDDGTDPKGSNNLEVYADLKPLDEWGAIHGKDELVAHMYARLAAIPGVDFNFSQYIKDNVEEALSGVKGELVVKIFGPDLAVLQQKAEEVQRVMSGVTGVADLAVEQQFGQPQLRFEIDRSAIARYGLSIADVDDAIETAVGGRAITQFLEGDRVFDVRLRFAGPARDNLEALRALAINAPDGHAVPLASVAHLVSSEGASRISREANERRIAIKCSVRGRDEGSFVSEAQGKVERDVALPAGYRITWGGQFENQRRATARLALIVPASIILIFILLFSAFGSVKYATLILANLPFALIGGILALWFRGIHLSVSAAVGFIALFGISVQNGVLLVSEFNRLRESGHAVVDAVHLGTMDRLRPVVMTALMAALGLLPAALSHGIGAETTRPFASVIVGGLVTSTVLTLLLLPVLYDLFHEEPHAEVPR
ncbi:MAG: CusA/CzcA family heavy metal efflux RND transporter [Gemmatimonadota bacterium]|nr:CusA/CzcA family heavy metal efflux RND transporter [Gemmatimonadota bacterium]